MEHHKFKNQEQANGHCQQSATGVTDSLPCKTEGKGRSARSAAKATAAVRASLSSIKIQTPQPVVYEGIGAKPAPSYSTYPTCSPNPTQSLPVGHKTSLVSPNMVQVESVKSQVPAQGEHSEESTGSSCSENLPVDSTSGALSTKEVSTKESSDTPSVSISSNLTPPLQEQAAALCPLYRAKLPSWQISGVIFSDNSHIVADLNAKSSQWIRPYRTQNSVENTSQGRVGNSTHKAVENSPAVRMTASNANSSVQAHASFAVSATALSSVVNLLEKRGQSGKVEPVVVDKSRYNLFDEDTETPVQAKQRQNSVVPNTVQQVHLSDAPDSSTAITQMQADCACSLGLGSKFVSTRSTLANSKDQLSEFAFKKVEVDTTSVKAVKAEQFTAFRVARGSGGNLDTSLPTQAGVDSSIATISTTATTSSSSTESDTHNLPNNASTCGCVSPDISSARQEQVMYCPVEMSLSLLGGKYKSLILWKLLEHGTLRFQQLRRLIPKATPKILTQQLRELEEHGLVRRTVYPVVPPKVEYSLTDLGITIQPLLEAMYNWGAQYLKHLGHNANCTMNTTTALPKIEAKVQIDLEQEEGER